MKILAIHWGKNIFKCKTQILVSKIHIKTQTHYSVIAYMGEESKKEWIYVYV